MTTSEFLRGAKQELLDSGWCQGRELDPVTGEMCATGALWSYWRKSGGMSYAAGHNIGRLVRSLVPPIPSTAVNLMKLNRIAWWNDEPGRTPEEVLDLFDRAIAIAEQQEQAQATPAPVRVTA